MSERLKLLVDECCKRNLTPDEIEELTDLAVSSKSIYETMNQLLTGGEKAAFNLRFASKLRLVYSRKMKNNRKREISHNFPNDRRPKSGGRNKGLVGSNKDIYLTDHAIERYIERFDTKLSFGEANKILQNALKQSKVMKGRTLKGQERWISPEGFIFVVKRDKPLDGNKFAPAVVTVIPREYEISDV